MATREQIRARLVALREEADRIGHSSGYQAASAVGSLIVWLDAGGPAPGLEPLPRLLARANASRIYPSATRTPEIIAEAIALLIPPRPDYGHGPAGGSATEHRDQRAWDRDYGHLQGSERAGTIGLLGQVFDREAPCGCGNATCSGIDDPEHACGGPAEACAVAGCAECGAGRRESADGEPATRREPTFHEPCSIPECDHEELEPQEQQPPQRAVADLSDDEIVDAVAAFGIDGLHCDDGAPDGLLLFLGLSVGEDQSDLLDRLFGVPDRIRQVWSTEDGEGFVVALTPAEWGRRIEAALAPAPLTGRDIHEARCAERLETFGETATSWEALSPECQARAEKRAQILNDRTRDWAATIAGTVARLLEGERGEAADTCPECHSAEHKLDCSQRAGRQVVLSMRGEG